MLHMDDSKPTLSDDLRRAIEQSSLSRYRISKETGIDQACLSRFKAGKVGLTTKNWDAIGRLLGLRIVRDEETDKES